MRDPMAREADQATPTLGAELIELPGGRVRLVTVDGGGFELPEADAELIGALRQLDGHTAWAEVAASLQTQGHAADLRSWLTANSLLCEPSDSSLAGWRVRLYGTGQLGAQLARGLLRAGVDRLTVVSSRAEHDALGGCMTRLVRDPAELARVRFSDHWTTGVESTDLAIVAGPHIEPDRAVLADLHAQAVPTLVVSVHLDAARVGPLFVPERTPCWRCRDLHVAEADPAWPQVLLELTTRPARGSRPVVGWAANLALLELAAFHDTGQCDLITHAVCWGGRAPGLSVLPVHQHPRCGCGQ